MYFPIFKMGSIKKIALNTNNFVLYSILFKKTFFETHQFTIADLNFEQETIDILKKYTPIEDIRVEFPQRADEIKIFDDEIQISNLLYGLKTNNEWFKWEELSDGTRRIVWIILNVLIGNGSIDSDRRTRTWHTPASIGIVNGFYKRPIAAQTNYNHNTFARSGRCVG